MTTATEKSVTTQVYRVFIKASAQRVWEAITKSEWAERYGYGGKLEMDVRPGGKYVAYASPMMKAHGTPDVVVVGDVIEADPPRRLVQTWHPVWDPTAAAEKPTRLTWELEEEYGAVRVTLTHDVAGAPSIAKMVAGEQPQAGGGWPFVLSDLKTLVETGKSIAGN